MIRVFAFLCALLIPTAAFTQGVAVVAVPPLAIPASAINSDNELGSTALQISQVIASDLRSSGEILPLDPEKLQTYSLPEATAPSFKLWRGAGAKAVLTGFVQRRPDGRLTVGCYVYDVAAGRELGRQGFAVAEREWRRAAHRCADLAYSKLTGRPAAFGSRMAYVAESGAGTARVKRIAMMDADGSNHRFLTAGDATVLTPRISPDSERLAYVSFVGGRAHVRIIDLSDQSDRPLLADSQAMSFAPRFSGDGRRIVFSLAADGNTDIYVADANGGGMQRLTFVPGIDTSPSFSPDGTRIVFESDRSGSPQLYVMNADGSAVRRLSFGAARYSTPVWSPDGELIAFTRTAGDGLRIGVMSATGGDEKLVTSGPRDEGPSWSASSRQLLFQRADPGRSGLYAAPLEGTMPRAITTPLGASDPEWSSGEGG